MDTGIFDEYPGLRYLFENMMSEQQSEFFETLKNHDTQYAKLVRNRVEQSMVLRNKIKDFTPEFEKYTDFVYAQELYEFEKIYTRAFCDALAALKKLGSL